MWEEGRIDQRTIKVRYALGVYIARGEDQSVTINMPLTSDLDNGVWLSVVVTPAAARDLADELYLQAGRAEEATKEDGP